MSASLVVVADEYYQNEGLFSNHFLSDRLPESDDWEVNGLEEKFEELKDIYESEKATLDKRRTDEEGLRHRFISPILSRVLDFEFEKEKSTDGGLTPDYALYASMDDRSRAVQSESYYEGAVSLFEAKAWQRNLEKYTKGGAQDVGKNPLFQLYRYLVNTEQEWGVLSNGEEWRLLHQEASSKLDSYYSVNIVDIIEDGDLEAFKWFYLFFRRDAFTGETSFLDELREESVTYATAVGEDLEDNVYRALEWLAKGYTENQSNYDNGDRQLQKYDLEEIQENCLIFLYRLLFAFYADSRGMLGNPSGRYERYSFKALVDEVCKKYDNDEYGKGGLLGDRLSRIFRLIDQGTKAEGIPSDEYHVPAYNGGLFSNERHPFLETYNLHDHHLAEVINLLARTDRAEKDTLSRVDYHDLSVRHLGGIYEGLLEYNLAKASENLVTEDGEWKQADEVDKHFLDYDEDQRAGIGDIYLRTDSGERKATGSYYTPDYIVKYIVDNTIGPRIDDKLDGLGSDEEKAEAILDLTVLDPAMGSGHFLVEATDYIASRLTNYAELTPKEARREVARRCIYGVDINPLATELAKVSLWLKTMDQDRPLSFLDHHLKTGNSLVGTSLEDLGAHPESSVESSSNGGQQSLEYLFEDSDDVDIQQNIQQLLYFYQNIVDSAEDNPDDIYAKEEEYQKFKDNKFRRRFDVLADVYTSYYFGNDYSEDDYQRLLEAFQPHNDNWDDITSEDWVRQATDSIPDAMESNLSDEQGFFHWELEFPEIFFDIENGQQAEDDGFDTVIGNPPWVSFGLRDTGKLSEELKEFFSTSFTTAEYKIATYPLFMENALKLANESGYQSFIVPDSFLLGMYFSNTRTKLIEDSNLAEITLILEDFWKDADIGRSVVYVATKNAITDIRIGLSESLESFYQSKTRSALVSEDYFKDQYRNQFRLIPDDTKRELVSKIEDSKFRLKDVGEFYSGCISEYGKDSVISQKERDTFMIDQGGETVFEDTSASDKWRKLLPSGSNISRYNVDWTGEYIYVHPDEEKRSKYAKSGFDISKYEGNKIFIRQTGDKIVAAADKNNFFCLNNMHVLNIEKHSVEFLSAILNSKILEFYYKTISLEFGRSMAQTDIDDLENLPIPDEEPSDELNQHVNDIRDYKFKLSKINLQVEDYIGTYSNGEYLRDSCIPVEGRANSILTETADDREGLKIGQVEIGENSGELVVKVSVKYKPDEEEEFHGGDLDRWGYTESDFIPAMRFDVDEKMEALIREFVPVAVEEAGGFAGFRENATKTKSILDRLENLQLPKLEDVESGLEKYLENKQEAERLEEEIAELDAEIDAEVFDLYGLDENEIGTVLDSLDVGEEERQRIHKYC